MCFVLASKMGTGSVILRWVLVRFVPVVIIYYLALISIDSYSTTLTCN